MAFQNREDSVVAAMRKRSPRAARCSAAAVACAALVAAGPAAAQQTVIIEDDDTAARRTAPVLQEDTTIEESVPNRGLIISGAVLLGATYGASAIVAATSDYEPDKDLYIPIAGPWINLAQRDDCDEIGAPPCRRETTYKVLLVADGIGQAVGALQIVGGFLFPAKRTRRTVDTAFVVTPRLSPEQLGLSAMGTF
jgi:hypothetical protein